MHQLVAHPEVVPQSDKEDTPLRKLSNSLDRLSPSLKGKRSAKAAVTVLILLFVMIPILLLTILLLMLSFYLFYLFFLLIREHILDHDESDDMRLDMQIDALYCGYLFLMQTKSISGVSYMNSYLRIKARSVGLTFVLNSFLMYFDAGQAANLVRIIFLNKVIISLLMILLRRFRRNQMDVLKYSRRDSQHSNDHCNF